MVKTKTRFRTATDYRPRRTKRTNNIKRIAEINPPSLSDLIETSEIIVLKSKGIKAAPPSSSFVKSMINKYELLDSESKDKMLHEVNRRIVELNSIRNRPSEKSMRAYKKLVKDD